MRTVPWLPFSYHKNCQYMGQGGVLLNRLRKLRVYNTEDKTQKKKKQQKKAPNLHGALAEHKRLHKPNMRLYRAGKELPWSYTQNNQVFTELELYTTQPSRAEISLKPGLEATIYDCNGVTPKHQCLSRSPTLPYVSLYVATHLDPFEYFLQLINFFSLGL